MATTYDWTPDPTRCGPERNSSVFNRPPWKCSSCYAEPAHCSPGRNRPSEAPGPSRGGPAKCSQVAEPLQLSPGHCNPGHWQQTGFKLPAGGFQAFARRISSFQSGARPVRRPGGGPGKVKPARCRHVTVRAGAGPAAAGAAGGFQVSSWGPGQSGGPAASQELKPARCPSRAGRGRSSCSQLAGAAGGRISSFQSGALSRRPCKSCGAVGRKPVAEAGKVPVTCGPRPVHWQSESVGNLTRLRQSNPRIEQ